MLNILRKHKDRFTRAYGVTALGVLGSVARREANAGSDVDVVIRMSHPDLYYMVHIKEALEEALQAQVDVVLLSDMMNVQF